VCSCVRCLQFREVLESAAGKAVDVTLDSAWIAVCGTDNRALKPAEDMHAAFLKVLLADDTAERVMQSDFLLLFEPDILNFAEAGGMPVPSRHPPTTLHHFGVSKLCADFTLT
jgi:hypothetical protein